VSNNVPPPGSAYLSIRNDRVNAREERPISDYLPEAILIDINLEIVDTAGARDVFSAEHPEEDFRLNWYAASLQCAPALITISSIITRLASGIRQRDPRLRERKSGHPVTKNAASCCMQSFNLLMAEPSFTYDSRIRGMSHRIIHRYVWEVVGSATFFKCNRFALP
jgi:hypothetical protein